MDQIMSQVHEFHRQFKCAVRGTPGFPDPETLLMRLHLIQEELSELALAFAARDTVRALDALADLDYVVSGTYLSLGLQRVRMEAVREVHRSNMSKTDENGDAVLGLGGRIIKSNRYRAPDLHGVITSNYSPEELSEAGLT